MRRSAAPLAILAAASLCALAALPHRARAGDDREPSPPWVFFPKPDDPAAADIEDVIQGSFGDVNKVVEGREALVKRFGLWSLPALAQRVDRDANEPQTWNSALTIGALRRTHGAAPAFWPAVAPLVKLLKASSETWRAVDAALALGCFYGPESVPVGLHEDPDGPAARARAALTEGRLALLDALSAEKWEVRAAAALALAKNGGFDVGSQFVERLKKAPPPANPAPEVANLIALGLLPGSDDGRLQRALSDSDTRVRAGAALGIACWATTVAVGTPDSQARFKAPALDRALQPTNTSALRMVQKDGAAAVYARGILGLLGSTPGVWADLYRLATAATPEKEVALAAAQALLFCPDPTIVEQMWRLAERGRSGSALEEPVLAAFLVRVGSDGTIDGVKTCAKFLRDRARLPRGRLDYDVRYHATVGLVRALEAGRMDDDARFEAIGALNDALRGGLLRDPLEPREGRSFRAVLEKDVMDPWRATLPERLPVGSSARLEAVFTDPDALLARDAIDTTVDRLNDEMRDLLGLNNLVKAASGGGAGGARVVSRDETAQRFLLRWLDRYPYFTRLDLRRDRGRAPRPVPSTIPDPKEIDR